MSIAVVLAQGIAADRDSTKRTLERTLAELAVEAEIFVVDWGRTPSPTSRGFFPSRSLPDASDAALALRRPQRDEWALWNDLMLRPFLELEAERIYGRRLLDDEPNFMSQKRERDRRKALFERLANPQVFQPETDPIPGDEAEFATALAATGIGPALDAAREPFLNPEFQEMVADLPKVSGTVNRLIARALVAAGLGAMRLQGLDPDARIDLPTRRALVDGVLRRLGGDSIGIGEIFRLAAPPITDAAIALRLGWAQSHWDFFREFTIYQSDADAMGSRFDAALESALATSRPTLVVGHGLGSVIAFERSRRRSTPIHRLATLGSPVPLLVELGWLEGSIPKAASSWINVYDLCDPMSFRAGPVFGDDERILDIPVDSGWNPQAAHEGYWGNVDVWRGIAGVGI